MDRSDWALFALGVGIANPSTRQFSMHVARDVAMQSLRFGWNVSKSVARHLPKLGPARVNLPWIMVAAEVTSFASHARGGGTLTDYDPVIAGRQSEFILGLAPGDHTVGSIHRGFQKDVRDLTYWAHRTIGRFT